MKEKGISNVNLVVSNILLEARIKNLEDLYIDLIKNLSGDDSSELLKSFKINLKKNVEFILERYSQNYSDFEELDSEKIRINIEEQFKKILT